MDIFKGLWNRSTLFKMTPARLVLDVVLAAILLGIGAALAAVLWMPGRSFTGAFAPLTAEEQIIEGDLHEDVLHLAEKIGERNSAKYEKLQEAIAYIEKRLKKMGYEVHEQEYFLEHFSYKNIWAELRGTQKPSEIVVIGGHYDSVVSAPGADDNGSGAAATLELARLLAHTHMKRTVRFVFFTNEEPPYFSSEEMGSFHYALGCVSNHENIVAMLDPETLGYYTEQEGSQHYPSYFVPFYPTRGNFVAFVGNTRSRPLVEACIRTFRGTTRFASEGVAAPEFINGVDWADHRWFWKYGYQAVMITDTALFRYPHYHTKQDTPDKLNYPAFARVVGGLRRVVEYMAGSGTGGVAIGRGRGMRSFSTHQMHRVRTA